MLTGFYFMAALIGVIFVAIWEIINAQVELTGETRGLLKMRSEKQPSDGTSTSVRTDDA